MRLGDITEVIQKFTAGHWDILASLTWHIWKERNNRLRNYTLRLPEKILEDSNKDILNPRIDWV